MLQSLRYSKYDWLVAAVQVDPVVDAAAKASGLDIGEIKSYLPAGLTIWIDPREVSCRLTENGPVQVIYRGGSATMVSDTTPGGARRGAEGDEVTADRELQRVNCGYDSFAAGARVQNLSPSPGWSSSGGGGGGGGSPVTGATARVLHPPLATTTCFTAATFAQTKFGSTKMKSQGPQRPSRLSPIESMSSGFPARLSPSSAPLSAGWGLGSTTGGLPPAGNGLSPMQQSSSAQFGMMPSGGCDARLASLQDWIVLQHRQQQHQMQYLTALKQQQQQHGFMTSPVAPSLTNAQLAAPHHFNESLRQHLPQLQQHVPPLPAHGIITSPDIGLFPPLIRDSGVTSGPNPALKNDNVHLSPAECVDWGLDASVPGFANGLQQLLLAN